MHRRELLATGGVLAGAVAGCLDSVTPSQELEENIETEYGEIRPSTVGVQQSVVTETETFREVHSGDGKQILRFGVDFASSISDDNGERIRSNFYLDTEEDRTEPIQQRRVPTAAESATADLYVMFQVPRDRTEYDDVRLRYEDATASHRWNVGETLSTETQTYLSNPPTLALRDAEIPTLGSGTSAPVTVTAAEQTGVALPEPEPFYFVLGLAKQPPIPAYGIPLRGGEQITEEVELSLVGTDDRSTVEVRLDWGSGNRRQNLELDR